LDYRKLSAELPTGVEPGYDGLVVELSGCKPDYFP
jgi:hypothetical protein